MYVKVKVTPSFIEKLRRRQDLEHEIAHLTEEAEELENEIQELQERLEEKQQEVEDTEKARDELISAIVEAAPDIFLDLDVDEDIIEGDSGDQPLFKPGDAVTLTQQFNYVNDFLADIPVGTKGVVSTFDPSDNTIYVRWANTNAGFWHKADQLVLSS